MTSTLSTTFKIFFDYITFCFSFFYKTCLPFHMIMKEPHPNPIFVILLILQMLSTTVKFVCLYPFRVLCHSSDTNKVRNRIRCKLIKMYFYPYIKHPSRYTSETSQTLPYLGGQTTITIVHLVTAHACMQ